MKTIKGFAPFGQRIRPKDGTLEIKIQDIYEHGFEYVVRYEVETRNNRKNNRDATKDV